MNLYYLSDAIQLIRPGSEFVLVGNNLSEIKWIKIEGEIPTVEEIEDALDRVESTIVELSAEKAVQRQALLDRLGITEEEAKLLLS